MTGLVRVIKMGGLVAVAMAVAMAHTHAGEESVSLEGMSIEELRAFQGYYFASGLRDPMTMRLPTSEELGIDTKGGSKIQAPTIEQMELFLNNALENITAALKKQDFDGAIRESEQALYVIDNEWPPLKADPPHLRRMDEEIRSYNRMAVRLKAQEDIKNEFLALRLRVEGISWSPTDAKAVVNGRLLAAGEVMLDERKQGDLRIEMIEEFGVVFQFKGIRFRLPVEMYASP